MTPLNQRRNTILFQIRNNPFNLVIKRPTTTTSPGSGASRLAPPFSSIDTARDARVAMRTKAVPGLSQDTPQEPSRSWFLLTDFQVSPLVGDQFDDGDATAWEVMAVTKLSKFGGVIGYESDLRMISAPAGA